MPRIYSSRSNPFDYCVKCFPKTVAKAITLHGNDGNGPDGRGNCFGYEEAHPDYQDEGYRCEKCNAILTERDN